MPERELELVTGPVGHGGFCVARHEGRVVFVRHALPGERVRAAVTEDRGGSYLRADAVEVLAAADDRVAAPCPAAGPGRCGGCDFQHVAPAAQRRLKADVVAEALRRIAGIDLPVEVEALSGGPLGWRTQARLGVDASGRAGFRAHRSSAVVAVTGCPIAAPGMLDEVLGRRWSPDTELDAVRDDDGAVHVVAHRPGRRATTVAGSGRVVWRAAGRTWRLGVATFWQVHPAAADTLAGIVADWAGLRPGGRAWDLYGGVGLFGSVLADLAGPDGEIVVVESAAAAVADGRAALRDLPQLRFVRGEVSRVVDGLTGHPDVVVLDPPRKGAGKRVAAAVARHGPGRIVHIACDPAALARDVAAFADAGYRLSRLRALDAFPMTHHVECVALLEPRPA